MRNFNIGALEQWVQISTGQVLDFPVPSTGPRTVSFEVNAAESVSVVAVQGETATLLGAGDGHMLFKFTTAEDVGVVCLGSKEADLYIKTYDLPATIPESFDPTFTTLEPRAAQPAPELLQLMQIVQLNSRRREQALLDEIERIRSQPVVQAPRVSPEDSVLDEPKGGDVAE